MRTNSEGPQRRLAIAALVLGSIFVAAACGDSSAPPPSDGRTDRGRRPDDARPGDGAGRDAALADGPVADAGQDHGAGRDAGGADQAAADAAADLPAADFPVADAGQSDGPLVDLPVADAAQPDGPTADLFVADTGQPDGPIVTTPTTSSILSAGGTDPGGKYVWNEGRGIFLDGSGSSYVTGKFIGQGTFGPNTLTCAGQHDIVVFKVSPAGQILWGAGAGGTNWDEGLGIAVDSSGSVVITGYYQATASFGAAGTLTDPTTWHDGFVAKLAANGQFTWATAIGNADSEPTAGVDIVADSNSNVYVAGLRVGATPSEKFNLFEVTSSGSIAWSALTTTTHSIGGRGIALDDAGKLWTAGTLPGANTLARVATDGTVEWNGNTGGSPGDVAIADGDLFLTGGFSGTVAFGGYSRTANNEDIFVARVSQTGQVKWVATYGGAEDDTGRGIVTDSAGNSYVTGSFSGTVNFGNTTVSAAGTDIFVMKLSPTGSLLSLITAGGTGEDIGYGIARDATNGDILVTGGFEGDVIFGTLSKTSGSTRDIFVWRLSSF